MICRGCRQADFDYRGLTAGYVLPQRVSGYRPTSRAFSSGYRELACLTVSPLHKIARSRALLGRNLPARHTLGVLVW